jgi:hypothetical protein
VYVALTEGVTGGHTPAPQSELAERASNDGHQALDGRRAPPAPLDEGELVIMAPASFEHGRITGATTNLPWRHVAAHRLDQVVSGEVGFRLQVEPETLRAADVAFTSFE